MMSACQRNKFLLEHVKSNYVFNLFSLHQVLKALGLRPTDEKVVTDNVEIYTAKLGIY